MEPALTVIIDRAHWVCEYCHDENTYTGPGAYEKACTGGAEHVSKCPRNPYQ